MRKLFESPQDKLYSVCTIAILTMIIFPPVYWLHENGSSFRGYEFVFTLRSSHLIDIGRLSLQFIALGSVAVTIKRLISNT